MSKTSHYKATTKRGFEAGELAALLASHSPNADYKVVISFRGKVRELIVEEDTAGREAVAGALHDRDAAACLPLAEQGARSEHFPRDFEDDQRHDGKLEAALHDPERDRTRRAAADLYGVTMEELDAVFGDPRLSNLDRRDGREHGGKVEATFHAPRLTEPARGWQ